MNKLSLFSRLAVGNIKRNKETYYPYIIACVVTILTFFNLLYINQNEGINTLRGAGHLKMFTAFALIVVSIFCVFVLLYTNSFIIKRRKKELALYSIMGLEKKDIAKVLVIETLITGAVSLFIGILSSTLLSKLFTLIMLKLSKLPVAIPMPFSFYTCAVTCIFFAVILLLILLTNLVSVAKSNPIQLMSEEKKGEKEPKGSIIITILGFACLAIGYYMAVSIKNPAMALFAFILAALLVIIGTYLLFISGSVFILGSFKKNKKYYYKANHFISLSNLIYRMKQNAAGLATICILICAVLVSVSSTITLYFGSEDSLKNNYPHDLTIETESAEESAALLETVKAVADKHHITLLPEGEVTYYRAQVSFLDAGQSSSNMDSFVASVEDYNKFVSEKVVLESGDVLFYTREKNFLGDSIEINQGSYPATTVKDLPTEFKNNRYAIGYYIIANNDDIANMNLDRLTYKVRMNHQGSPEDIDNFTSEVNLLDKNIYSREAVRSEWYALNGGFMFIGGFFGIIFILATAMIIYYKQITEGFEDKKRYNILQKVGMSNDEVKNLISKQVKSVFYLPFIVAVLHIIFASVMIYRALSIFGIENIVLFSAVTLAVIVIFGVIYSLIYKQTSKIYYKIVKR